MVRGTRLLTLCGMAKGDGKKKRQPGNDDAFYAELRRCRDHCNGRPQIQHRTIQQHDCDERCRSHVCKPLSVGVNGHRPNRCGAVVVRRSLLRAAREECDTAATQEYVATRRIRRRSHDELGADHTGGEFLLAEQRPRAQSRGAFTLIPRGHGLVCTLATGASDLLAAGRLQLSRHGVSAIRSGRRHTLGLVFHDVSSQVRAYA
jgi:hypothetical protein